MTLKITQAAREAAADLIECLAGGKTASSVKMRIAAADDYPEVQAFQRAMNQAADEALERGFEATINAIRSWRDGFYGGHGTLDAVVLDLERNRETILATTRAALKEQDNG